MKLVIIVGPHAVGKMTVGQELAKITNMKLFHNHMTIEVVSDLFSNMPQEYRRLVHLFRQEIFETFVKSDEYGIIFTYMWAFEDENDWNYINKLEKLFLSHKAEVYYVELEADYDIRIERNKTENRLVNKPSKRDIVKSEQLFRRLEDKHRLNSHEGEIKKNNYLRINNTSLSPEQAAVMIKSTFLL
jgi:shikimate kinase